MRIASPLSTCALACLLGCASQSEGAAESDPFAEADDGQSGVRTAAGEDSDSGDTGARLDVGEATGSGTAGDIARGCTKLDFLFVIDDSSSMLDNQQNLVASFPGFIAAIRQSLGATDFHVMVVDSSVDSEIECKAMCDAGAVAGDKCPPDVSCPEIAGRDRCETILGAGVTYPRGRGSSRRDCGFPDGRRYITAADDLEGLFQCAALVGTSGMSDEQPMGAMAGAVSEFSMARPCNDGFLRDDAILVVTVVTDAAENDEYRLGKAEEWAYPVIEAKGGNPDAIVMLVITDDAHLNTHEEALADPTLCDPWNMGGAEKYYAFPEQFGARGHAGSICLPDYGEFLSTAVDTIRETCDDFVPVG